MSKSTMLRTRRRDINIKPNRRLDRKSSRGMIYENEELRLRTININAEVEKGQSDIKKLRRENEQLRREIWCLRDEYEKLDKLLKTKHSEEGSEPSSSENSGSSSDEDSDGSTCPSCDRSEETNQNHENVDKLSNRHKEFDSLSVVAEENIIEKSEENTNKPIEMDAVLGPDESYPVSHSLPTSDPHPVLQPQPKHFFSPLPKKNPDPNLCFHDKTAADVFVNQPSFGLIGNPIHCQTDHSKFQTGGNLEELLQDIEIISNDILKISTREPSNSENCQHIKLDSITSESSPGYLDTDPFADSLPKPYKSEINVVLMPNPMPLIGFEKYKLIQQSNPEIASKTHEEFDETYKLKTGGLSGSHTLPLQQNFTENQCPSPYFIPNPMPSTPCFPDPTQLCQLCHFPYLETSATAICCPNCMRFRVNAIPSPCGTNFPIYENVFSTKPSSSDQINLNESSPFVHQPPKLIIPVEKTASEINSPKIIEENFPTSKHNEGSAIDDGNVDKLTTSSSDDKITHPTPEIPKSPTKSRKTRKLSIHFNGSKKADKSSNSTPVLEKKIIDQTSKETKPDTTPPVSTKTPILDRKMSLGSNSSSVDKKHVTITNGDKKHKCHESKKRRKSISNTEKTKGRLDQKSSSFEMSRSRHDWHHRHYDSFNEFTSLSERERTNSLTSESSRNTNKSRKLSTFSTFNSNGKVPWCGCWGNGCL